MSVRYTAIGATAANGGYYSETGARVEVIRDGVAAPLTHHVHHSPDGFAWGYSGSGPSELARCILWDLLGSAPEPALYHAFKAKFIAPLNSENGFDIGERDIRAFLIEYAAS